MVSSPPRDSTGKINLYTPGSANYKGQEAYNRVSGQGVTTDQRTAAPVSTPASTSSNNSSSSSSSGKSSSNSSGGSNPVYLVNTATGRGTLVQAQTGDFNSAGSALNYSPTQSSSTSLFTVVAPAPNAYGSGVAAPGYQVVDNQVVSNSQAKQIAQDKEFNSTGGTYYQNGQVFSSNKTPTEFGNPANSANQPKNYFGQGQATPIPQIIGRNQTNALPVKIGYGNEDQATVDSRVKTVQENLGINRMNQIMAYQKSIPSTAAEEKLGTVQGLESKVTNPFTEILYGGGNALNAVRRDGNVWYPEIGNDVRGFRDAELGLGAAINRATGGNDEAYNRNVKGSVGYKASEDVINQTELMARGIGAFVYEGIGAAGGSVNKDIYIGAKQRQLTQQEQINSGVFSSKNNVGQPNYPDLELRGKQYYNSLGQKVGYPIGTDLSNTSEFSNETVKGELASSETSGRIAAHLGAILATGGLGQGVALSYALQSESKQVFEQNLEFGLILGAVGAGLEGAATSRFLGAVNKGEKVITPYVLPAVAGITAAKVANNVGKYVVPIGLTAVMGASLVLPNEQGQSPISVLYGNDTKASRAVESGLFGGLGAGISGATFSGAVVGAGITAARSRSLSLTGNNVDLSNIASQKSIAQNEAGVKFYPQKSDYGAKTLNDVMNKFNNNEVIGKLFGKKSKAGGVHVSTSDLGESYTVSKAVAQSESKAFGASQNIDASLPFGRTIRMSASEGKSNFSIFKDASGKNPSANIILNDTTRIPKSVMDVINKKVSGLPKYVDARTLNPLDYISSGKVKLTQADKMTIKLRMIDDYLTSGKIKGTKGIVAPTMELGKTEMEVGQFVGQGGRQVGLDTFWQKQLGASGYSPVIKQGLFGIKYQTNMALRFYDASGKNLKIVNPLTEFTKQQQSNKNKTIEPKQTPMDVVNNFFKPKTPTKIPNKVLNLSEGLKIISENKNLKWNDLINHNKKFDKPMNLSQALKRVSENKDLSFRDLIKAEERAKVNRSKKEFLDIKSSKGQNESSIMKFFSSSSSLKGSSPNSSKSNSSSIDSLISSALSYSPVSYPSKSSSPSSPSSDSGSSYPSIRSYIESSSSSSSSQRSESYLPPKRANKMLPFGGSGGGEVQGKGKGEKQIYYNELEQILNLLGGQQSKPVRGKRR